MESAVYYEEPGRFRQEEVQKIADDYAIDLPAEWTMDIIFARELPGEAVPSKELPVALHIVTNRKPTINKPSSAKIVVLNGEAENKEYRITARDGKICIGREKKVQTADGFFRVNTIAFPADSSHQSNKYISRQHAHIEWDAERGVFMLFADEGGIPPRNKIKVRSANGDLEKLQTTQIGYPLNEGDQIILGDSALMEFRIDNE